MPVDDPVATIARAYAGGPWLRGYVRGKLRGDPVFAEAAAAIARRALPVVDLGCGLGLLGMWLRAHGIPAPYSGCDLGGWKIASGTAAAKRLGWARFSLSEGDMRSFPLESPCAVCAFDVIHYLTPAARKALLQRLAGAARDGSLVLLRTGVRGCGWRTCATLVEEWWTRASGWIRGGRVDFPELDDLVGLFHAEGCRVDSRPLWGRTPFSSHWLEVCARG